jgi:hypothetical protein
LTAATGESGPSSIGKSLSLLAGDYGFELALPYLSIPLSFLLANFYVRTSWKWVKEISLLLILAVIIYYQYLMIN